jgi:hypothetical protein
MLHSMMHRFSILILLCTPAILLHSDQSIEELVRPSQWFSPEIEHLYIRFVSDYYIIGAYEGAGDLASGDYKILDPHRISLSKPVFDLVDPLHQGLGDSEFVAKVKNWVSSLWTQEELVLRYNPNYVTLSITGSLDAESGRVVFISTNKTKEGATFKQYGKDIIKEQGRFFVLENLIMREKPSKESDNNYYEIAQILYKYKFDKASVKTGKARIVPKGYDLSTIARTADVETINGRKAPWYLYYIETDHMENDLTTEAYYIGWVFGGYLAKYSEEKSSEYRSVLEKNLREMGWLQPTEVGQ